MSFIDKSLSFFFFFLFLSFAILHQQRPQIDNHFCNSLAQKKNPWSLQITVQSQILIFSDI